jgi:serine/threonine-protein kinase HipA
VSRGSRRSELLWRLTDEVQFAEFVRRLIFNAGVGNNDMHLKNWSLIYPGGRTPQLAPAYDFVSTVRYIADDRLALSIAKEKAPNQLNLELLERFARKAQVPNKLVLDTARETALTPDMVLKRIIRPALVRVGITNKIGG